MKIVGTSSISDRGTLRPAGVPFELDDALAERLIAKGYAKTEDEYESETKAQADEAEAEEAMRRAEAEKEGRKHVRKPRKGAEEAPPAGE